MSFEKGLKVNNYVNSKFDLLTFRQRKQPLFIHKIPILYVLQLYNVPTQCGEQSWIKKILKSLHSYSAGQNSDRAAKLLRQRDRVAPKSTACISNCMLKLLFEFNPTPNKPWLLHVCSACLLKTQWEKEKLLIMSNFSFSHSVFYPSG